MKYVKSALVASFMLLIISFSSFANETNATSIMSLTSKIENYLSSLDQPIIKGCASIFVDLKVSDKGHLYNVDFLVSDEGKIVILSNIHEGEFYSVDRVSTKFVKKYSVPIVLISA